jgi:hypothetical protein
MTGAGRVAFTVEMTLLATLWVNVQYDQSRRRKHGQRPVAPKTFFSAYGVVTSS